MRLLVFCSIASALLMLIGIHQAWAEFKQDLSQRMAWDGTYVPKEVATPVPESAPRSPQEPGQRVRLNSTAYCLTGKMANGRHTHDGAAAKNGLPFGTEVTILSGPLKGKTVTIEDRHGPGSTGLDVWIADCGRALEYGRRDIDVEIGGQR